MKKKQKINQLMRVLLGIILIFPLLAIAQNNKSIERMGAVDTQSFDQGWLYSRYGLQPDGTRLEEPKDLENTNQKDASWQKLNLPHDWAIAGPFRSDITGETGKLPWRGIGWYRKHFTVPAADKGKQIFVDFDGAMANAKIWLNGQYVGTWPYGYSSFRMDLTPYIKPGQENIIAVRLDTENWDSRWYPGAGIYRHVWLVKTNPVHVGHWGTYVTTPEVSDKKVVVKLAVTVDNQSDRKVNALVQTSFFELDINNKPTKQVAITKVALVEVNPNSNVITESQTEVLNPQLWDIVSPNRYVAQTTISIDGKVIDSYNTPFGIRTIEFSVERGFLLNGKKVVINGTCNHHDLGALGAAINTSALRRQLKIQKEMGVNSLRTSHNPPAPELLELADQMGFLVWDEAFDNWKEGKKKNDYNKIYDEWHEKDLKALIHRDRNHPSVFIWSIGNEVPQQRDVEITKHLADIVKREDPTRPVSNGYNDPDASREVGAPVSLDLMGVNYFFSQQAKWEADPRYKDMPTIASETSSCVSSRGEYFFGDDYQNWQISSYDTAHPGWGCTPDEQFRTNVKFPKMLGEYVWTGFDYLGEPTPYNSDDTNLLNYRSDPSKMAELEKKLDEIRMKNPPSRSSYFGIIDLAGFPKDRFYSYQSQWKPDLPMAHILPHWNWKDRMGLVTPIHVYTSGDEAELFLNGKSLGRKVKKQGVDFRLIWDDVIYVPGELKVMSYKNGKEWATDIVKTTAESSKLVLSADRNTITADGVDYAFITVKVTDKEGLTVPRSQPLLQFSIEGDGEIVATDNGDATSFVPFQSHQRKAFNGMALVIVKAKKGKKGQFTVVAKNYALETGKVKISVN